jgi:hypothetical protein
MHQTLEKKIVLLGSSRVKWKPLNLGSWTCGVATGRTKPSIDVDDEVGTTLNIIEG